MNEHTTASTSVETKSSDERPAPPLPKVKQLWRQWPLQKVFVTSLAAVAVLGIAGTIVATTIAVRNNEGWTAEIAQRNTLASEYEKLETDLADTQDDLATAEDALLPQYQLAEREMAATTAAAAAKSREDAVKAREDAITAKEQHIKQTSLPDGKYTVGVSMEPGTYRTESTNTRCYWAIYTSGTNYDDIVQNDLGSTGVLTVTVRGGQDFETRNCGTWAKVG